MEPTDILVFKDSSQPLRTGIQPVIDQLPDLVPKEAVARLAEALTGGRRISVGELLEIAGAKRS